MLFVLPLVVNPVLMLRQVKERKSWSGGRAAVAALDPWKCSKPGWRGIGAPGTAGGIRSSLSSLTAQIIPWWFIHIPLESPVLSSSRSQGRLLKKSPAGEGREPGWGAEHPLQNRNLNQHGGWTETCSWFCVCSRLLFVGSRFAQLLLFFFFFPPVSTKNKKVAFQNKFSLKFSPFFKHHKWKCCPSQRCVTGRRGCKEKNSPSYTEIAACSLCRVCQIRGYVCLSEVPSVTLRTKQECNRKINQCLIAFRETKGNTIMWHLHANLPDSNLKGVQVPYSKFLQW